MRPHAHRPLLKSLYVFVCSLLNSCDKSVAAEVKAALDSIKSELSSISDNNGAKILLEILNK